MRRRHMCMVLAGMMLAAACLADNSPTTEQQAAMALAAGRHPVALSGDGKWVFHVDAARTLRRKSAGGLTESGAIKLGMPVFALSASRSGKKVALLGPSHCLAIVTFDGAGPPAIAWFRSPHVPMPVNANCRERKRDDGEPDQHAHQLMALSSDAKLIAIASDSVKVIEVEHPQKAWRIPTGNIGVLRLKFADADRKLLVVQSKMGVGEVMPLPGSNMQFSVWDLQKKELFNLHATADADYVNEFDLLSTYSDGSGEALLFANKVSYLAEDDGQRQGPVTAYSVDLKRCGASRLARPAIPHEDWVDAAADPHGRWSAAVLSGGNLLLRSRAGKVLMRRRLGHAFTALTPSNDGNTLFGSTPSAQPEELEQRRPRMHKDGAGGQLKSIDLSAAIAALPRIEGQWAGERCLVEDEAPQAREIAIDPSVRSPLSRIGLALNRPASDASEELPCGWQSDTSPSQRWHVKHDGSVLIDSGTTLDQRDPANGRLLRRLPNPRSKTVCSTPNWKENRFLNWQGDTVSASPLEAGADMSERKLLVRMPGWRATAVEALGSRFGVRWVSAQCKSDGGGMDGGALAITYDKWGKELHRENGNRNGCNPEFVQDEYGPALFKPDAPAPAKYRWEASYAGSVRARATAVPGQAERTVLWSGLTMAPATLDAEWSDDPGFVKGLCGSVGAHFLAGLVDVYDAATRSRIARIKLDNPTDAAWHEASRTLLIENREPNNAAGDPTVLRVFRID